MCSLTRIDFVKKTIYSIDALPQRSDFMQESNISEIHEVLRTFIIFMMGSCNIRFFENFKELSFDLIQKLFFFKNQIKVINVSFIKALLLFDVKKILLNLLRLIKEQLDGIVDVHLNNIFNFVCLFLFLYSCTFDYHFNSKESSFILALNEEFGNFISLIPFCEMSTKDQLVRRNFSNMFKYVKDNLKNTKIGVTLVLSIIYDCLTLETLHDKLKKFISIDLINSLLSVSSAELLLRDQHHGEDRRLGF